MLVPTNHFNSEAAPNNPIRISVFGSTGSIGTSTLEIVRQNRERFQIESLVAGSNIEVLTDQAKEFSPKYIGLADSSRKKELTEKLQSAGIKSECVTGQNELSDLARVDDSESVVCAIVGSAGLPSVLSALSGGKKVLLANKESLVCAGKLVEKIRNESGSWIIPIDSEHSALFQALQGHRVEDISRLVLTASGGPFLNTPIESLAEVTPESALKHPRWNMGPKVTIDSSTMFNKALEVIEAYWLFGIPAEKISVVVHPQSIVHSLIDYSDGSQIAQLSHPDMKGPISYALSYPHCRVPNAVRPLKLEGLTLQFLELDNRKFPAVNLAQQCVHSGKAAPAVFSMANENAVGAFLSGRISYLSIFEAVSSALEAFSGRDYSTLSDLLELEMEVAAWFEVYSDRMRFV